MSYILDALRKADAQRQRTRLPGLHAQAPAVPTNASSSAWWRSPVAWVLGSALAVLAVVLIWPSSQQPASVPVPTTAAMQDPAPAPSPAAPPVQVPAAPTVVADATPPAATTIQPAPPPAMPERRSSPRAMRSTPDRVAPPAREASAPPPAAPAPAATAPAAAPAAVAAAAESSSVPPGAPKLAITGGVYSSNAAQRLLIVGGQVFNEGSEVAPGVVLEQVRPNQALLNYQGQRYTVRY